MVEKKLAWQSKLVLLAVLPFAGADVVLADPLVGVASGPSSHLDGGPEPAAGPGVLKLRAATRGGALAGATITASLMFSTVDRSLSALANGADSGAGRLPARLARHARWAGKRKSGWARRRRRRGRTASQVAANLGVAAHRVK